MMTTNSLDGLQNCLSKVGRDFSSLADSSKAIVLFGSRAMDVARNDSDWDLLCFSREKSIRSEYVDLVCVTPDRAKSVIWLGSELASHVSKYGILVHGDSSWLKSIAISDRAISKKREKIIRRVATVHLWWNDFVVPIRQKHFRLIKNDLSRLNYLVSGKPVPPTSLLDSASTDGYLKLVSEFGKKQLLPQTCVAQLNSLSKFVAEQPVD